MEHIQAPGRQADPGRMPELLLPAGGFDAAMAAFEGGADAVYLGFQDFSARKQARNFDREEYRRLLRHARETGKRIYVTVNTVIREAEIEACAELLGFLSRFSADAIIFQDWGLASMLRRSFPAMALHASTQTAIQTPEAARLAASLGVSRIVLPREFGLDDLARMKREAPDLEYEVFVHGALCYSFSGLCLASGVLLGRSGNRGECAQVCRSYYRREDGQSGYWFSCRDLNLADEVASLVAAGAASFKVEGRMKSPEYAFAVARLYRKALDLALSPGDSAGLDDLLESARVAFARAPSHGWLRSGKGEDLIDSSWPGHRGGRAGKVIAWRQGKVTVRLDSALGLRDGVLAFDPDAAGTHEGRLPEPSAFAVTEFSDAESGRPLFTAPAGGLVEFASPKEFPPGTELRRISSRQDDRRKIAQEEFEAAVEELPAVLSLEEEGEGGSYLVLEVEGPAFGGAIAESTVHRFVDSEALPLEVAKVPGSFSRVSLLFAESGQADFRFRAALKPTSVMVQGLQVPIADLFIPPSLLKKAKNRLYSSISGWLEGSQMALAVERGGLDFKDSRLPEAARSLADQVARTSCPPRNALVFASPLVSSGLPFLTSALLDEAADLPLIGGLRWLPLSPLVRDWEGYSRAVRAAVEALIGQGERIVIGIDAFHHLPFARSLLDLDPAGDRLAFFGDIHLYCANQKALSFWKKEIPRMAFAYAWLEDESFAAEGELKTSGEGFMPPLFMSKGCYARHNLFKGACPSDCGRRYSIPLADRDRHYRVVVDDCITMLFGETPLSRPGQPG